MTWHPGFQLHTLDLDVRALLSTNRCAESWFFERAIEGKTQIDSLNLIQTKLPFNSLAFKTPELLSLRLTLGFGRPPLQGVSRDPAVSGVVPGQRIVLEKGSRHSQGLGFRV